MTFKCAYLLRDVKNRPGVRQKPVYSQLTINTFIKNKIKKVLKSYWVFVDSMLWPSLN